MAIHLNVELALTGMLYEIIKHTHDDLYNYFCFAELNDVKINYELLNRYLDWLSYSDCGPIIADFDKNQFLNICQKKQAIFEKVNDDMFKIKLDIPDCHPMKEDFFNKVVTFLISEFQPKMNYPKKFHDFMFDSSTYSDFEVEEDVKVKTIEPVSPLNI